MAAFNGAKDSTFAANLQPDIGRLTASAVRRNLNAMTTSGQRFRPSHAHAAPARRQRAGRFVIHQLLLAFILMTAPSFSRAAEATPLAFRPSTDPGFYECDTGVLRGKLRLNGKWQGMCSLVHAPTGFELAKAPGLFSYYRVFTTNHRHGDAARDFPWTARLLPDGALEITTPAEPEHPVAIRGIFRWTQPDTLDLETTVTPETNLPDFELFLSNYVAPGMAGAVYVQPNRFAKKEEPALLKHDWHPLIDGNYLMFPRDLAATRLIMDGRWEYPPSPVTWAVSRYMAGPLAVRREATNNIAVVLMAPPADCFAMAAPYNKTPPDNVANHSSMYLSLFGRNLPAGQPATVRSRLVIRQNLSDAEAIQLFKEYSAAVEKRP